MTEKEQIAALKLEVVKLRDALEGLICWVDESIPTGPSWGTPEARASNEQMRKDALEAAYRCFPENYNGFVEHSLRN